MRVREEVQAMPPFSIVAQDNTQGFWLEWTQTLARKAESFNLQIENVHFMCNLYVRTGEREPRHVNVSLIYTHLHLKPRLIDFVEM